MTRGRYEQLMRFLHFNNKANAVKRSDPSFDHLLKLRPLLNHLNQKFPEVYMPGREIVVDESLVPFHGRLAIKQYIPSKRARYGVKVYKLCESGTGYTYSFRVYEGKDSSLEPAGCPPDMGTSGKIVVDLVNPLLHKGYHLYEDNFYSGVPLFKFLYTAQTMACGTVRLNQKGLPSQVLNTKLKRGESCSLRSNELLSLKYKDKRDVLMLSTIHTEATMTCQSRRQQIQKPVAIAEYSQYMGAVDFSDQMMAPYLILRKTRAWYKKVGIYLLQMAMYNSYVIFKKSGHGDSYLKFQEQIITSLIFESGYKAQTTDQDCEDVARFRDKHFPAPIPPTPSKPYPQRRCKICSKHHMRRDSRYYCPQCASKPSLCLKDCFEVYHTLHK
ncbi:piggyBac transposable element-derived protein 4-like [Hyperolius riggenbachi]|uniref:piggyBac transposable element-derived protein 4-like n=1 Tax=Hyperolius riggenbachi TaxID=752182 RepID=UPI0035A353C6